MQRKEKKQEEKIGGEGERATGRQCAHTHTITKDLSLVHLELMTRA